MLIVWHRRDLRIHDHPALHYASKTGLEICPLYIYNSKQSNWTIGSASKVWLHHALEDLRNEYNSIGASLTLKKGRLSEVFSVLLHNYDIKEICFIEQIEPEAQAEQNLVLKLLEQKGIKGSMFEPDLLIHPKKILNGQGKPYVVFTPFSKVFDSSISKLNLYPKPTIKPCVSPLPSETLQSLSLLPKLAWNKEMISFWNPTRKGAEDKLKVFSSDPIEDYKSNRDFLEQMGTSELSPYLAFGQISPREIWSNCERGMNSKAFLRQLVWREFAHYFLYYFPESTNLSWRKEFENYPWIKNQDALKKWTKGLTGYPIVDAAMRQLWKTGWMHNRARLIVGSFLIKDLHTHWIEGAKWFWDTLLDANLANNTLGWQWVAGSGPDAAPYFRIFNPVLQSKKFDPEGKYIKKYIPELQSLPAKWIHEPWNAPGLELASLGVTLGQNYPYPIVDHAKERDIALKGFEKI